MKLEIYSNKSLKKYSSLQYLQNKRKRQTKILEADTTVDAMNSFYY
jgi:hypothetical protein